MTHPILYIQQLPEARDLPPPSYMSEQASGLDLRAAVTAPATLAPGESHLTPTGIRIALPPGYEAQVRPRSGLASQHGITVLNAPGTIDADYRGELCVLLINHSARPFVVNRGDRIAQLIVAPVTHVQIELVERLDTTPRGSGGFGHTGR
ncbi:MAG: dUTP diphosphatase [Armatimonadota bacterium]|nr:MAG: dUTP diphosphatase [Armatimonadota bacterium]